jgi:hypothetical protein
MIYGKSDHSFRTLSRKEVAQETTRESSVPVRLEKPLWSTRVILVARDESFDVRLQATPAGCEECTNRSRRRGHPSSKTERSENDDPVPRGEGASRLR